MTCLNILNNWRPTVTFYSLYTKHGFLMEFHCPYRRLALFIQGGHDDEKHKECLWIPIQLLWYDKIAMWNE